MQVEQPSVHFVPSHSQVSAEGAPEALPPNMTTSPCAASNVTPWSATGAGSMPVASHGLAVHFGLQLSPSHSQVSPTSTVIDPMVSRPPKRTVTFRTESYAMPSSARPDG